MLRDNQEGGHGSADHAVSVRKEATSVVMVPALVDFDPPIRNATYIIITLYSYGLYSHGPIQLSPYTVMAHIVMAHIVMAHIVMGLYSYGPIQLWPI